MFAFRRPIKIRQLCNILTCTDVNVITRKQVRKIITLPITRLHVYY